MAGTFKLNHKGVEEILKSREVAALVHDKAEQVAENVRAQGIRVSGIPGEDELPVEVRDGVTDRARSVVAIDHPAGLAVQAKHGALSKAASAAGLEVTTDE